MPHHKSTIKRLRQNEAERTYNRAVRTRLRNAIKAVHAAPKDAAVATLTAAYADLDRAVKKGVIPRERAARIKSRLAKKVNAGA